MRNRLGCFWSSPVRTPDVIPFDENYTYFYMNITHWHPKIYAEKKLNANLLTIILGTIRVLRPPPPATKTPESLRRQLETIDFTLAEFATENAALNHAATQPNGQGLILKIKNLQGYVSAEQILKIQTTGPGATTLSFNPPDLREQLATPVSSAFHAQSHLQLIASIIDRVIHISEDYLLKYPQKTQKLFFWLAHPPGSCPTARRTRVVYPKQPATLFEVVNRIPWYLSVISLRSAKPKFISRS